MSSLSDSQAWALRRFQGLVPEDFEDHLRIFSVFPTNTPPGFERIWSIFQDDLPADQELLTADECDALNAVLVLCDPTLEQQVRLLQRFVLCVDGLGHDAPLMLWVPHTIAPERRSAASMEHITRGTIVSDLLDAGLDGIMPNEPEGLDLALAARGFIHKSIAFTNTMSDMVNDRRVSAQYAEYLQECTHELMWDYLRRRLAPTIPPEDFNIPEGAVTSVGGYQFMQLLGKGAYGAVYLLEAEGNPLSPLGEAMKVVDKSGVTDLQDLKSTKRMIDVMRLVSSEQWRHQNVVQLFDVYHSPTHLFFRMEFAGHENLFRRLTYRQRQDERRRPMSGIMTHSLFQQAIASVAHLHTGPSVCHRDIKPENFIVHEEGEQVVVKLADFDLALVQANGVVCRSPCGTFPFVAPEVILDREYNGMQADIWSLGTVLFEVLCGIRVVESIFDCDANAGRAAPAGAGGRPGNNMVMRVKRGFELPGAAANHLTDRCLPELRPMLMVASPMLTGMLKTVGAERWQAEQVIQASMQLPVPP